MIQFCRLPAQATHAFGRSGTQLRHALSFDQQFSDTFTVVRSMASAEAADSDVESLRETVRRLSLQARCTVTVFSPDATKRFCDQYVCLGGTTQARTWRSARNGHGGTQVHHGPRAVRTISRKRQL